MSIASQIQLLAQNKAAIKAAIEAKSPATAPGDALADWPASIASIPSGGGVDEEKPVRFYEYDGTLLYSYTAEEAQALTEMPAVPVVTGRTSQGWNYTLAQMKELVSAAGACDVGHFSSVNAHSIVIGVCFRNEGDNSISLPVRVMSKGGSFSVDWGDGGQIEEYAAVGNSYVVSIEHAYSFSSYPAEYTICLDALTSNICFLESLNSVLGHTTGENRIISSIDFGTNGFSPTSYNVYAGCTNIKYMSLFSIYANTTYTPLMYSQNLEFAIFPYVGSFLRQSTANNFFNYCTNLKVVSLGVRDSTVTSLTTGVFYGCTSLRRIIFPLGLTKISGSTCRECSSLESVFIPNSVSTIEDYAFYGCRALKNISIPSSVTSIGLGAFQWCTSLSSFTIHSSVTSIGNSAFYSCYNLEHIEIPSTVTSVQNYCLEDCKKLAYVSYNTSCNVPAGFVYGCTSLRSITFSSSFTTIGQNAFRNCSSLKTITLPSSVTTFSSTYTFGGCTALEYIKIPAGVANIPANTFNGCRNISVFDFSDHTSVPTLANTSAFTSTSTAKHIVVPDALYDTWVAASNWSSGTNNIKNSIIKKSDFDNL